ncbi:MAG: hypothetical protein R6V58_05485, partial [Planctomycetota bacterium]
MSVSKQVTEFTCPRCRRVLEPPENRELVRCAVCSWKGRVRLFRPLEMRVEPSVDALPEDAVCVHHPKKLAVAVCEGSGDYICSLCAVELNGKTYSAQYLSKAGQDELAGSFDRYLERPDRAATTYLVVSVLFWPLAVVLIPMAIYQYVRIIRLRKKSDIFRRVQRKGSVVLLAVFVVLFCL